MSTNTLAYLLFMGFCGCSILALMCTEFLRQFLRRIYDVEQNLDNIKAEDASTTEMPRRLPCLPSRLSSPHPISPPRAAERIIEVSESCIDCAVCQGPLDDSGGEETVGKTLPLCGHKFHRACIVAWLEKTATCPVCRRVYPFPSRLRFNCIA